MLLIHCKSQCAEPWLYFRSVRLACLKHLLIPSTLSKNVLKGSALASCNIEISVSHLGSYFYTLTRRGSLLHPWSTPLLFSCLQIKFFLLSRTPVWNLWGTVHPKLLNSLPPSLRTTASVLKNSLKLICLAFGSYFMFCVVSQVHTCSFCP